MIIAIANEKGGVAKTTSTIALGALLGQYISCLVIDFDPQRNLTLGLGVVLEDGQPDAYHVLTERVPTADAIVKTEHGVSLIPANKTLAIAQEEIRGKPGNFFILKEKLEEVRDQFEYILIDCPPSLGLLTTNALTAAHGVIIPVQCQLWALDGMNNLLETIETVKRRMNPELEILGALPTMEDGTVVARDVISILQGSDVRVFDPVPKSVQFAESSIAKLPISAYTKNDRLVQPYRAITEQLIGRA